MTRRIAGAILLTVWAILVAGGFAAYWVTRAVLLSDLDRSLVESARSLPEVTGDAGSDEAALIAGEDRYVIRNDLGQTIASPGHGEHPRGAGRDALPPYTAAFAPLGDGRRVRTVTVRVAPRHAGAPMTVVYSRPTDALDRLLGTLAAVLTGCGAAAGAAAAAVAVAVARTALHPLHAAADVVGVIDEQKLDRRIDEPSLPPELRPVAARLNSMLERLERAFAQRKRFLADASHELRTPVAALVTALEVALRRKRDAAELTRTLELCLVDARYLRRLVTRLLEHARGETARRAPNPEPFDAAELLDQCATIADALGASRDVRVVRSYRAPIPVVTEPDRLRGIVTNLLANAVEHNRPGGTVELSARVGGGDVELSVRDTGPGIAAEHVPHLFEPFYRTTGRHPDTAAPGASGEEPHLGLGLFIVDSHVKALGGRCTVDSTPGVGTTFRVSIPQAAGTADGATADAGDAGDVNLGGALPVPRPPPTPATLNISASPALLHGEGLG